MENKALNYGYLATKYLNANVVVHDRTYEGLEWHGPGNKPAPEFFASLQENEDREARKVARQAELRLGQREEVQRQARARAAKDAIPFMQQLDADEQEFYQRCKTELEAAMEVQSALRSREHVLNAWKEISATQLIINAEAQTYLDDTAHYLSWEPGSIPAGVLENRKKAQERLSGGKTVYADWSSLRSKEMPSRQELHDALVKGGEHLERMKKICREIELKYPKPKKEHY